MKPIRIIIRPIYGPVGYHKRQGVGDGNNMRKMCLILVQTAHCTVLVPDMTIGQLINAI